MITLNSWHNFRKEAPTEGGFTIARKDQPHVKLYIRFYEWNMFGAFEQGQHTHGPEDFEWEVSGNGDELRTHRGGVVFKAQAREDGADLFLQVTNETGYDWTEPAGMIPCFSPGDGKSVPQISLFADHEHTRTYYLGHSGLELLEQREIHFNDQLREEVDHHCENGEFVFSYKWPTSDRNAVGGLLLRESADRRWIAAIAWDDFLSAQGHNPWNCMHLGVHIGSLRRGESRLFRGRIYLFEGTKEECLERYRRDFSR